MIDINKKKICITENNYSHSIIRQVAHNEPVEIGDKLIFIVAHSTSEMSDSNVSLLGPPQIRLRNQNVTHAQHTQSTEFLREWEFKLAKKVF